MPKFNVTVENTDTSTHVVELPPPPTYAHARPQTPELLKRFGINTEE